EKFSDPTNPRVQIPPAQSTTIALAWMYGLDNVPFDEVGPEITTWAPACLTRAIAAVSDVGCEPFALTIRTAIPRAAAEVSASTTPPVAVSENSSPSTSTA